MESNLTIYKASDQLLSIELRLLDLQKKGIPIVESYYIPKGTKKTLAEIHENLNWSETVIKPTVSGAARHTYRLNPTNYTKHEKLFATLIQQEDFVLQPFQKNVPKKGEVSHIVIGGKYSHSILKLAKKGDYRVQDDHGGTIHPYTATKTEINLAEHCTKACTTLPIYARVDLIWNNTDELVLIELELIEPELWFRKNTTAAYQLADTIFSTYFNKE